MASPPDRQQRPPGPLALNTATTRGGWAHAASIARVAASAGGYSVALLARPEGYMGADGLLVLMADGQVRRGLGIFEVQRGGPQMIEPAPQSVAAPGA